MSKSVTKEMKDSRITDHKRKGSKYVGVEWNRSKSRFFGWRARWYDTKFGTYWSKWCDTEREAAIAYDIKMIELGRPPVNILKRKL